MSLHLLKIWVIKSACVSYVKKLCVYSIVIPPSHVWWPSLGSVWTSVYFFMNWNRRSTATILTTTSGLVERWNSPRPRIWHETNWREVTEDDGRRWREVTLSRDDFSKNRFVLMEFGVWMLTTYFIHFKSRTSFTCDARNTSHVHVTQVVEFCSGQDRWVVVLTSSQSQLHLIYVWSYFAWQVVVIALIYSIYFTYIRFVFFFRRFILNVSILFNSTRRNIICPSDWTVSSRRIRAFTVEEGQRWQGRLYESLLFSLCAGQIFRAVEYVTWRMLD